MTSHSEVSPDTLAVDLTADGVEIEYADGRRVFYRGVPRAVDGPLTPPPGRDVHVLVTAADDAHGILVYVDERTTEDDILESTGVGRVLLDPDDEATIFPGVTAKRGQMRVEIAVDHGTVDGRVFVFAEDARGEQSYELVPASE
jgi:hypothetical protein